MLVDQHDLRIAHTPDTMLARVAADALSGRREAPESDVYSNEALTHLGGKGLAC